MNPARMVAIIFTAVVVLYPLSVGPAVRMNPQPGKAVIAFYGPLRWLVLHQVPFAGDAVLWYANLWTPSHEY